MPIVFPLFDSVILNLADLHWKSVSFRQYCWHSSRVVCFRSGFLLFPINIAPGTRSNTHKFWQFFAENRKVFFFAYKTFSCCVYRINIFWRTKPNLSRSLFHFHEIDQSVRDTRNIRKRCRTRRTRDSRRWRRIATCTRRWLSRFGRSCTEAKRYCCLKVECLLFFRIWCCSGGSPSPSHLRHICVNIKIVARSKHNERNINATWLFCRCVESCPFNFRRELIAFLNWGSCVDEISLESISCARNV